VPQAANGFALTNYRAMPVAMLHSPSATPTPMNDLVCGSGMIAGWRAADATHFEPMLQLPMPIQNPIAPRPTPTRHALCSAESSSSTRRKMRLPMRALHPLPAIKQSLSWLLWLALLLPLAHSAAIWHGYSHSVADAAGYADDKGVPLAAKCDLCLASAGASGGALPADAPGLSISAARHEMPPAQARSIWLAPPALAYLSRAPPLAPR